MTFTLGDVARIEPPKLAMKYRACGRKVLFEDREDAERALATLYSQGKAKKGSIRVYACVWSRDGEAKHYHVGHWQEIPR